MADTAVADTAQDAAVADLQPGLHTAPDEHGDITLIAHRCTSCGTRCFPQRMRCVSCFSDDLEPAELGRVGTVDAFTIVHQAPPGYFGHVPYVLAMVQVDNDVITLSHLLGQEPGEWKRGDKVASCELVLPVGSDRQLKRTHAFRPVVKRDLKT